MSIRPKTRVADHTGSRPASEATCVVCGLETASTSVPWASICRGCGAWRSSLEPAMGGDALHQEDESTRELGLRAIRQLTFEQVLDRVDRVRPLSGARVLDVGSAHGWFLEASARRGAVTKGIEPNMAMVAFAAERGLDISPGLFPGVLEPDERFDLIAFNDVLEHIPGIVDALEACHRHLEPGGVLSVNIPTSDGAGYRVASCLARVGVRGPFERLWQYGLPSPHVHYFPRAALVRLLEANGFVVRETGPVTAVVRRGLWQRIHVYRRPTVATVVGYVALMAASPVFNAERLCDVFHVVAERKS